MISPSEQHFLDNLIPSVANQRIVIHPYSVRSKKTAEEVMAEIHAIYPDLDVRLMSAVGLGISGQNDLDIYALVWEEEFEKYLPGLKKLFGLPKSTNQGSVAWKFTKNNYDVELYLTNPNSPTMQKQIKVFETLKNNPTLLKEYKELKRSLNGSTYKEYQTKKYEFYNRILADARVHQDEQTRILGERHAGIIIKDSKLLLIHRLKNGFEYYVFPGGHRRDGEDGLQTVIREFYEETGITVTGPRLVFEFRDYEASNTNYYYICEWESGTDPHLTGEELGSDPKINFYDPMWVSLAEVDKLSVLPKYAKYWLLDYLERI